MPEPDEITQDIARYCHDWGEHKLDTIARSIRVDKHKVRHRVEDGQHSHLFSFNKKDGVRYVDIDADISDSHWYLSHTYDRLTHPIPEDEFKKQLQDTRESVDHIYDVLMTILDEVKE